MRQHAGHWNNKALARLLAGLVFGLLAIAFPANAEVPNPAADLDRNGIVDLGDFLTTGDCVFASLMGKPFPPKCGQLQDPHPAGGGDGDWDLDDYLEVQANIGQVVDVGDTTPPTISIVEPADGALLAEGRIQVRGSVDDLNLSIELEVSNASGTSTSRGSSGGGSMDFDVRNVALAPGLNRLTARATDLAGNVGSHVIEVSYQLPDQTAPAVRITSPTDGAVLQHSPIQVTGTVDDATATVRVNGSEVTLVDGQFAAEIALSLGANTIQVAATDPAGNLGSDRVTLIYQPDVTAPVAVIVLPYDGARLNETPIQVIGTLDDASASVTVNGVVAAVEEGSFTVEGIPLVEGFNQIHVRATDPVGNTGETSIGVTYRPPDVTAPLLAVDGGAGDRYTDQAEILLQGDVQDTEGGVSVTLTTQAFGGAEFAVAVDGGRWTANVPLAPGENPIEVRASDDAGNTAALNLLVQRQVVAETLAIDLIYPAHGAFLDSASIVVRGTLRSDLRALDLAVSVNGVAAQLEDTDEPAVKTFTSSPVALHEGSNSLLLLGRADDQSVQDLVQVTYRPAETAVAPPIIQVFSPVPDSVLSEQGFVVTGEVLSEAGLAELRIDGQPIPVIGNLPGPYHFSEPYAFAQGARKRTLLLEAKDQLDRVTGLSIVLYLDDQPPLIELDQPLEPAPSVNTVDQVPYPLSGTVTDEQLVGFTVAGKEVGLMPAAQPGSFLFSTRLALDGAIAREVLLSARDQAGNSAEALLVLRAETNLVVTLLEPAADLMLELDPDGAEIEVSVRLDGGLPERLEAVILDDQSAPRTSTSIGGEGPLRGARLSLPTVAGRYWLEVRALDGAGEIETRTGRSIELTEAVAVPLTLVNSDPVAGALDAEPNAPLTLFFNSPIDPALISLAVRETAQGETYVDLDPLGTDPVHAKGYQLQSVSRSHEPVNGSLSLMPGGRTLAFYPERELAYGAEVFVDIEYDGVLLGHFNYRTRALPTMLSGSVQDAFGQAVVAVEVALPGQARRATTDRNGGFAIGFGDAAAKGLQGGRWMLEVNPGMALAGYGSRRQWISIEAGRSNEIGMLRLAPLNRDIPPVPAAGGEDVVLLGGALKLDLSRAVLQFPDARDEGDLYPQFLSFSQLPFPATDLAVPHFLYGIHPAGVDVQGGIGIDLEVPSFNQRYDHLPPEDSFVILVGLDPSAARIVPVGVGQVKGKRVLSRGQVSMPVLDLIGYALAAPHQQDALAAYAAGRLNLPRLLAAVREEAASD